MEVTHRKSPDATGMHALATAPTLPWPSRVVLAAKRALELGLLEYRRPGATRSLGSADVFSAGAAVHPQVSGEVSQVADPQHDDLTVQRRQIHELVDGCDDILRALRASGIDCAPPGMEQLPSAIKGVANQSRATSLPMVRQHLQTLFGMLRKAQGAANELNRARGYETAAAGVLASHPTSADVTHSAELSADALRIRTDAQALLTRLQSAVDQPWRRLSDFTRGYGGF